MGKADRGTGTRGGRADGRQDRGGEGNRGGTGGRSHRMRRDARTPGCDAHGTGPVGAAGRARRGDATWRTRCYETGRDARAAMPASAADAPVGAVREPPTTRAIQHAMHRQRSAAARLGRLATSKNRFVTALAADSTISGNMVCALIPNQSSSWRIFRFFSPAGIETT